MSKELYGTPRTLVCQHLENISRQALTSDLAAAGAALHIIGRGQVTTGLPEWRQDKGKPLEEYKGLTRDQRTRGMGGLLTSCGEENLLRLEKDKYRGRDICVHEFAHNIRSFPSRPPTAIEIRACSIRM